MFTRKWATLSPNYRVKVCLIGLFSGDQDKRTKWTARIIARKVWSNRTYERWGEAKIACIAIVNFDSEMVQVYFSYFVFFSTLIFALDMTESSYGTIWRCNLLNTNCEILSWRAKAEIIYQGEKKSFIPKTEDAERNERQTKIDFNLMAGKSTICSTTLAECECE